MQGNGRAEDREEETGSSKMGKGKDQVAPGPSQGAEGDQKGQPPPRGLLHKAVSPGHPALGLA